MESSEPSLAYKICRAAEDDLYRNSERSDWSPYKLPRPAAIFWFVVQMQGIVGNGGFQYFFEADWPKSPPYSLFIDSLKHVGASEAAEILQKAVALFPFPEPHLDVVARNKFLDECREQEGDLNTEFNRLAGLMIDLDPEIEARLADYIRANLDVFPTAKALIAG